jgi:hypothetical protein
LGRAPDGGRRHPEGASLQLRNRPLDEGEVSTATRLYQSGLSLARVGKRLARDTNRVRLALIRAGIPRRYTHGRPIRLGSRNSSRTLRPGCCSRRLSWSIQRMSWLVAGRRDEALAHLLGQPYEKSFGPADVAEPIGVFVLYHFAAYKLRAVLAEPSERIVDVVHGEHDA